MIVLLSRHRRGGVQCSVDARRGLVSLDLASLVVEVDVVQMQVSVAFHEGMLVVDGNAVMLHYGEREGISSIDAGIRRS